MITGYYAHGRKICVCDTHDFSECTRYPRNNCSVNDRESTPSLFMCNTDTQKIPAYVIRAVGLQGVARHG